MLKRRQFLGCLTALSGSYMLAACGGSSDGGSVSGAAVNSASSSKAVVNAAVSNMSADATMIPPASSIIDAQGRVWTVSNGVIYRDGSVVGVNFNVALLLWYGGRMWHTNTSGQCYLWTDAAGWLQASDPRHASAAIPGNFYGMNGHWDDPYTPAQVVSILKGLGCTTFRVGCTNDPQQLAAVTKLAAAFQAAGLTLFVLINQGMTDNNGNVFGSEDAAYSQGYAVASTVANTLKQYGVTMYECGNELTRQNSTILDFTQAGTKAVDFNNTNWPAMRGVMRGMIDGVKSVQSNAKCGINFCVADVGAADALWEGMQPDGSRGYPRVQWDITTWHNYEVYGDIFNIGSDGSGPGFDLPTYCKARYNVPFMITEWNTGPEQSAAYRANYITTQLGEFYNARKTHNIQSAMYYVLDSGNDTYGLMVSGATLNQPYNAFTSFSSSHPDT
ncbi:cellulase family glycosylhydrolase [Caballeronia sp. DA-9]|uniref:cellulase family glycosylhydrolase n=1 Tax=Caballeronia sp. DA-9 TaxID=3436237 RepID=UPI003F6784EB